MNANYWKSVPRKSIVLFLLGVFFLFSTLGFASDISEMGRQPTLRYVLSILISGVFPVMYAFAGFALRKQCWKIIFPLFVVHFLLINVLANQLPAPPLPAPMDAAEIARMHARLSLDGAAITIAVGLGYVAAVRLDR